MTDELDPLPKNLAEALDGLVPPPEPLAVREALLTKLHLSTATAGAVSGAGAASATTAAAATGAGLTVPWWVGAIALVTGLAGGIAVDRTLLVTPPPQLVESVAPVKAEPVPTIEVRPVEPPPVREDAPAPPPELPKQPPREPVQPTTNPSKANQPAALLEAPDAGFLGSPPIPAETLRAERLLIDAARAALSRDPSTSLAPLEEHAARFPNGQLAEEREALRIQALVSTNDGPGARQRMSAFERDFPSSPLRQVLRAAVDGLE